jgi:hypothetical protein
MDSGDSIPFDGRTCNAADLKEVLSNRGWEPDHEESDLILSFARRFEGERIEAVLVLEDAICEEPGADEEAVLGELVFFRLTNEEVEDPERMAVADVPKALRAEVEEDLRAAKCPMP